MLLFCFLAPAAQMADPGLQRLLCVSWRGRLWQADPEGEAGWPLAGWSENSVEEGGWGESKGGEVGTLVRRNGGSCENRRGGDTGPRWQRFRVWK